MHHNHPELMKDVYWSQTVPSALPYTVETGKSEIQKPFKKCPDQDISIFPQRTIYLVLDRIYHTDYNYFNLFPLAHYRKEEPKGSAENKLDEDIYYSRSQVNYPIFKTKLSGSKAAGLDAEATSDYEAVDTNLIGWWKNKIRKSQMRRSARSISSMASK